MRSIGTIPEEKLAFRFEDYLLTRGIQSQIEQLDDGWIIWVHDEDKLEQSKSELVDYLENPAAERYLNAQEAARGYREVQDLKQKQAEKQAARDFSVYDRPDFSEARITVALIAICVMVAIATELGGKTEPWVTHLSIAPVYASPKGVSWYPSFGLQAIQDGQVWRLVTPMLLHFDWMHIFFNVIILWVMGSMIEQRAGKTRYLTLVLFLALISNLGQYLTNGPAFGGMSGVNYGLFGFIWIRGKYDFSSGCFIPPNTVIFMIGWFFFCLAGLAGNVANTAHGVGLVVGMILGYAPVVFRKR